MKTSFYSPAELAGLGFNSVGVDVRISRHAQFYAPERMDIGDHVRIDDFCILSGRVKIGRYVHISAYVGLYGAAGITIGDFATISGRTLVYSVSDDYSGKTMTNPMVPEDCRSVHEAPVEIRAHAIIGAGSVVLPGVTIDEGAAVGAMSLVKSNLEDWSIYSGVPARRMRERRRDLLHFLERVRQDH